MLRGQRTDLGDRRFSRRFPEGRVDEVHSVRLAQFAEFSTGRIRQGSIESCTVERAVWNQR